MKKYRKQLYFGTVFLAALAAAAVSAVLLGMLIFKQEGTGTMVPAPAAENAIMDSYDSMVARSLDNAVAGVEPIKWIYELREEDLAPEPNPACYGQTDDPGSLQWLLDAAAEELGVTDTMFTTQTQIMPGSQVIYYLDDSILSITWKEVHDNSVYTMSEVKIAHGSQFRRYVVNDVYEYTTLQYPTRMAADVNAVTASAGDLFIFMAWGVGVYRGDVYTVDDGMDTCYITASGDLLFTRAGELTSVEEAQQFVDDNDIRFSLAFGPVMIENGENVVRSGYRVGEPNDNYARMALCQLGERHYLLAAVNSEGIYNRVTTVTKVADQLIAMGVEKAFALDGGQSAVIITNDTLINVPAKGAQRLFSDIIYFATAIPEERWRGE